MRKTFGSFLAMAALTAGLGQASTGVDKQETVFVFEMIRHGARSHYEDNIDGMEFFGVGKGHLTHLGRQETSQIGIQRRNEYIDTKKLLSQEFDPESILSISTFKPRCADSGRKTLQMMYPLTDLKFNQDVTFLGENSPIIGTTYEEILSGMMQEGGGQCLAGPIQQVPHRLDTMMHTRNCKNVHKYLNNDRFDVQAVESMLDDTFSAKLVDSAKRTLAEHFNEEPKDLRSFFNMLDALIAEMYHLHLPGIEIYQGLECFILANNFYGPDEMPSKVYLSRTLQPVLETFKNVISNKNEGLDDPLRYLVLNVHETNVSNFLRFLGYWEEYGYGKFTKFSSSVRLELIKRNDEFHIEVVYDNEKVKFPWCAETQCSWKEFEGYFIANLITDKDYAEQYCKAQVGTDYTVNASDQEFQKNLKA